MPAKLTDMDDPSNMDELAATESQAESIQNKAQVSFEGLRAGLP
jgi:hypothetical protein